MIARLENMTTTTAPFFIMSSGVQSCNQTPPTLGVLFMTNLPQTSNKATKSGFGFYVHSVLYSIFPLTGARLLRGAVER